MPFTNYQRSQTTNSYSMNGTLIKELSLFKFVPSTDLTSQLNDGSNTSALKDSFFLLSITILTVSLCGLLTRWQFPITFVKPRATSYISGFMRHAISMCLVLLAILSQSTSNYILPFTLAATGALWYLSGFYLARRWKPVFSAVLFSSITCHLTCYPSSHSLLYTFNYKDCLAFTFLLVIACNALDHLDAILNTYPHLITLDKDKQVKFQNAFTASYWLAMLKLILNMPSESELHAGPIEDLNTAIRALGSVSRSWTTMAALFPTNLRQDLCLLYAFFRTADDLVDDAPSPEQCEENLVTIRKFLHDVFFGDASPDKTDLVTESGKVDPSLPFHIDWNHYASLLPNEDVLAIFRNFARISHYLCPRAMFELTEAWELDLHGSPVKEQDDLLRYAALISGTFGELCTCVIMYKTGRGNWGGRDKAARKEDVLSRARATGQCLQLINIARDIIADSLVGRCYVPLQYMPHPPQAVYHLLKVARTPMQVGEGHLKSFAIRILNLADQISDKAQKGIDGLPDEVQDSIRAAFEIYMAIGPALRNSPGFPLRAKVPKRQQQWIALRCIYGFRGPVARAISSVYHRLVSFYLGAFSRLSKASRTTSKAF
ncbi:hypothetical protein G6F43_010000 [Rhizopus delemar]|nr:hypothetical protein G6F43_010000 [Rhizopus delemar]